MKYLGPMLLLAATLAAQNVKFVDKLPGGTNAYYTGNRAPLAPSPLMKLPIGAVKPGGWLRHQLELEAEGFSGRLTEISQFCKYEGNAWVTPGGKGDRGWEEVPYWLKGFTDLGLILGDRRLEAEARKWLDAVLANQGADGYFGNRKNLEVRRGDQPEMNNDKPERVIDLWPNMIMLYPLRSLYEATGDARVLPFMTKYFAWQRTLAEGEFLPGSWQKYRGGDNLDSIYWLYDRTGEKWLLDLAARNHGRTADWTNAVASWHGVNFTQCFREPAQYSQQTRDPMFLRATERNYDAAMRQYGQVPGGMFGADENARPGYAGPRQAAETCSMVEFMHSDEMLARITGDPVWLDRAEDVAFNSLPAAMTPDLKGLHYLTAPNQVQLDRSSKAPMVQNDGDMFSYNPYQYRCCQHNVAFGWPYYAESLWMATPEGGLAAALYAPSRVTAKVAGGTTVQIAEETGYPFTGDVRLSFAVASPVRFPLVLRTPGWSGTPSLMVNGKSVAVSASGCGWLTVDRQWRSGDRVTIHFPMKLVVARWEANRDSVSVQRGPLTYSLKIGENWKAYATEGWPAYEVYPTSAWNYGLILDANRPEASIRVAKETKQVAGQPFAQATAPIELKMKARRIPAWKQEANGMVGELPQSPAASSDPVEEITLIPMGCARLRISAFPVVPR
jgi:DUF1680 family protein